MSILTLNSLLPRTEAFERFVDPACHYPQIEADDQGQSHKEPP